MDKRDQIPHYIFLSGVDIALIIPPNADTNVYESDLYSEAMHVWEIPTFTSWDEIFDKLEASLDNVRSAKECPILVNENSH